MSLAKNLRRLRTEAGLTQTQLAEKIGRKRSALAAWEEGRAEPPSNALVALADVLGCTVNDLLKDSADDSPKMIKDENSEKLISTLMQENQFLKETIQKLVDKLK